MVGDKWKIYWEDHTADTYLYGSRIQFLERDEVTFENHLMPPGTIIKEWFSKTNYSINKIEPTLPIIDGESTYRIRVNIDQGPVGKCMVRLVFYDKYENEAESLTLREDVTTFRCPLKTYSYRVQLVNGGTDSFCFHSIEIQEIDNEKKKK